MLSDSFRWLLAGETRAFGLLWNRLVGELARGASAGRWRLPAGPVAVDHPIDVTVELEDAGPAIPRALLTDPVGRVPIAGLQEELDPGRWRYRIWPRVAGWHRLALSTFNAARMLGTSIPARRR